MLADQTTLVESGAAEERLLHANCRRQNLFHIDPLGGIVAGVTGSAVSRVLFAFAATEQAFEG
jgi:hypothetical protein